MVFLGSYRQMLDLYLVIDTIAPFHFLPELVFTSDPKFETTDLKILTQL
jgi:N-dimethylarginine dimethylaminohydrolase